MKRNDLHKSNALRIGGVWTLSDRVSSTHSSDTRAGTAISTKREVFWRTTCTGTECLKTPKAGRAVGASTSALCTARRTTGTRSTNSSTVAGCRVARLEVRERLEQQAREQQQREQQRRREREQQQHRCPATAGWRANLRTH